MAPRRPSAWGSKHRVRLAASSYEAGTDRGHPSADGRGRSVTPRPAPAPATDAKHPAVLVHAGCVRRARRLERAALRAGEAFAEGSGAVGRVMWQDAPPVHGRLDQRDVACEVGGIAAGGSLNIEVVEGLATADARAP